MPAREPRYVLAEVTEESIDGWRDFCARHGTTPTALAEVIGLHLADQGEHLTGALERWVREARRLASERRKRG